VTRAKCNCGVSMGVRTDHEAECAAAYINTIRQSRSFLSCGHEAVFERSDTGRKYCLKCVGPAPERVRYHEMLDRAMDQTCEGESFLPRFTELALAESRSARPKRSCDDHVDCDKAMDEEARQGGTCLYHPNCVRHE